MVYNFDPTNKSIQESLGDPPNLKFVLGISAWSILGKSMHTDFPRLPMGSHPIREKSSLQVCSKLCLYIYHSPVSRTIK